ncbi:MAG TPA: xanthine phosphoribosyltransferase [Tissierellia bacterium]|nr:xanthine phosphoribosyltransferase [Tissierellia bacterium]
MKALQEKIRREGRVKDGSILKVDHFLNHQLDIPFLQAIGQEFYRLYGNENITKIFTIESSGIAIASIAALYFEVPVVFAKKAKSQNLDGELYTSSVRSYTYGKDFTITVAKKFLTPQDRVLIIDDFLAEGNAMRGLLEVTEQSGAEVVGLGIVIEKGFQSGGRDLRARGYRLESLAIVKEFVGDQVVFDD